MAEPPNKNSPALLDRDVSWLEFNKRVLHEAVDDRTPLLERVKFLAIFSSNLDEFFMKRIGVLTRRMKRKESSPTDDQGSYRHQQMLREKILTMVAAQADVFRKIIRPELARHGIHLLNWSDLTEDDRNQINERFRQTIYPVLTPLVVDPSHPFRADGSYIQRLPPPEEPADGPRSQGTQATLMALTLPSKRQEEGR